MRVKSLHLKSFKRFTDLKIEEIPQSAKLVLVVGPNGSGKSSLFDAFIRWYRATSRFGQDQDASYFQKGKEPSFDWSNTVTIEMYDNSQPTESSLYVRTAYRNDAEFAVGGINRLSSPTDELRVVKSIQNDQTVSQNYQRLVYETISGVYNPENDEKLVETLRNELIGAIRASMRAVFDDLLLSDISDPLGEGTFYFEKGTVRNFNYKNLSGGEKVAFDLLLDLHVKRNFYSDAIWCIDELETHLHTRVQGSLMREMFGLVPDKAQLWLSTHSLGVMRAAQALDLASPGSVALIDFEGVDPDETTTLTPSSIGRIAWEKMLSIAVDDLSPRVVASNIIVCEGSSVGNRRKNFDAEIYNRVLGRVRGDVVFISGGSSSELEKFSSVIRSTLESVHVESKVVSLCDRDDKSDAEVEAIERDGDLVLEQRNIESYLLADDVLTALAISVGKSHMIDEVLRIKAAGIAESVGRGKPVDDLKSAAGTIFTGLRTTLGLVRAGTNPDAFMRGTLAPLIQPGMETHSALVNTILDRLPN